VGARLVFVLYATDVAYFPELRSVYGFVRDGCSRDSPLRVLSRSVGSGPGARALA
jgi:hypothetical protein